MVLVDTSVWIEVFRKPARVRLEAVVDFDDVVTCLPVVQEVLQGFDQEADFRRAREAMRSLPTVESPLGPDVVTEAIDLYRRARRAGITVRSSVDCLIAACALRHDLAVLHVDRDFTNLAKVSQLEARDLNKR
ncbi:MAG TPA: PIN domain-containing protein [Vicinamibacterales bacterium]|nr:PIN domain-containing protein [Vicinamibacterales bacterium]